LEFSLLTHFFTTWTRDFLENLVVTQLFRKSFASYWP